MEAQKQEASIAPKRLYRSKVDRIIGGVCGGFAEYFNIEPIIVRVLWLVILFLSGIGIGLLIYLACLVIMKDNPEQSYENRKPQSTGVYWGIGLILVGLMLFSSRRDWDWFYFRPFHWHFFRPWLFSWDHFWPVIIILFGVFYLIHVLRQNKKTEGTKTGSEVTAPTTKLYRSREDKIIGGVCGGIAKNLNIDPVIVRIGWVILTLVTTFIFGIVVYIVWMIVVSEEPMGSTQEVSTSPAQKPTTHKNPRRVKKLPEKTEDMSE